MELGRGFVPEEDPPGRDQVIVLSHAFWRLTSPAIPGSSDEPCGSTDSRTRHRRCAPNWPTNPEPSARPRSTSPRVDSEELAGREDHAFDIIGRYRPGVTAAQAAARFAAIAAGLAESDPKEYQGRTLRAVSLAPQLQGGDGRSSSC